MFWRLAGGFTASASTEAFKKLSFISFSLVWQRSKAPPVELMLFRLIFDFLLHDDKTLNAFLRIMTFLPIKSCLSSKKKKISELTLNHLLIYFLTLYGNIRYTWNPNFRVCAQEKCCCKTRWKKRGKAILFFRII